jgi:exodeoxyribonuclease-5
MRNDRRAGVWNGETFTIKKKNRTLNRPEGKVLKYTVTDPYADGPLYLKIGVFEHFFQDGERAKQLSWKSLRGTQQFNYGYALTGHKAQARNGGACACSTRAATSARSGTSIYTPA